MGEKDDGFIPTYDLYLKPCEETVNLLPLGTVEHRVGVIFLVSNKFPRVTIPLSPPMVSDSSDIMINLYNESPSASRTVLPNRLHSIARLHPTLVFHRVANCSRSDLQASTPWCIALQAVGTALVFLIRHWLDEANIARNSYHMSNYRLR